MVRVSATLDRKSGPVVRELTVPAEETQLGRVRDFIIAVCEEAGFSPREISNTKLAVDEACTNIIKHAYAGKSQPGDITVVAEIDSGRIKIFLKDRGKHFDFSSVKDPDLDQYVETGRKGGLGVFLINRLMDGVEYRATDSGNELILTKRSQAAFSASVLPEKMPLRGTLRFKFMVRASGGLFLLMAALWTFIFIRQTTDINAQRTTQWLEKRRLAESVASRSVPVLLAQGEFSIEQTNLSVELSKMTERSVELAYVRLVDSGGAIRASSQIDEVFQRYQPPGGKTLLEEERMVWTSHTQGKREVRDLGAAVTMQGEGGRVLEIGRLHMGVFEDAVESAIEDTRLSTSFLLLAIFAVGLTLVIGLVQVFVKPIQVLTDGVRAIGDGNLEGKLDVQGPAEIGAIAGVFNEITEKFRKAQNSILEQEKMQKEIEVAKQIQQSLLPRRRPEISGYDIAPLYQAAAEVGGDYYDFVQVDDDTIGVVVADVSGKGVPGSLVMTMIRTALRMEARGNRNASDVMSKMNAFVTDDMKKGMFVTMFYVILDSKNRVISYASAGHNPMILYRHETRETFFLNPRGFPVGISLPDESLFRRSISLEKIRLKKDDMLVIYTDGVTEAMNERREQYGEDRLISMVREFGHLSPEDFIARLDAHIKEFTGEYPQSDDITVVAVKEKMTADDVLSGIRRQLLDMVDVQGMSVKDACTQMRVSPATYYRYKKRLETMGERGLRNDVLRDDVSLKRVSLEARKQIIRIIADNPDLGAKRITEEYNKDREPLLQISERMVYDELKRLNLNTKALRLDYLKRNRLLRDEFKDETDKPTASQKPTGRRDVVDELLRDIPGVSPPSAVPAGASAAMQPPRLPDIPDIPENAPVSAEGVGVSVSSSGEVTEMRLSGHVDSSSSTALERRLQDLLASGATRIAVDLSDVSYVSSGGWGIFVGEVRNVRERGGDIVLCGMAAEVYDVYELLGFADVLRAFPGVAEARAYLTLPPDERKTAPARREVSPDDIAKSHGISIGVVDDDTREWQSLRVEATTVGEKGEIAVLQMRGIVDTVSAEKLRGALDQILSSQRWRVVVDMSQVEYVSSGGWGVFTERLREVRRAGGDIKLFGMDPDVYYVFTMLGFNIVLSSFDVLADAIDDFRREVPAEGAGPAPDLELPVVGRTLASTPGMDLVWDDAAQGVRVATVAGVIETTGVSLLSDELTRELERAPRAIVFDLADVEYVSSSGWGQFARAYEATHAVALCGMSPELADVFACLEFHNFIPAFATREEAVAAVQGGTSPAPRPAPPRAEPLPAVDAPHDDGLDDVLAGDSRAAQTPAPSPLSSPEPPRTVKREVIAPRADDAAVSGDVDVDAAVPDRNLGRDQKLRDMGWDRYGKRLKKENKSGGDGGEPGGDAP